MKRHISRRELIMRTGTLAAATLLPPRLLHARESPRFRTTPFTLGVASGYPTASSVVLWTRLAPKPNQPGGGLSSLDVIPVKCEIATDERMKKIVRTREEYATAQFGHSIHCEPERLEPDREYWYRFTAGDVQSPIGRTRTAAAPNASPQRIRVGVASCQQYEHGYFLAYRHMLNDDLDCIVHVGDYIYETSWGRQRIRHHDTPEVFTLDDYRARYALYRSDPDLQAAHAHYPWFVTWDDHEVENDYAGATSEEDDPVTWFLQRRAAAYRAYYEHMPLPRRAVPYGAELRLYTRRYFGSLINLYMLDSRQYRDPLACRGPGDRRSGILSCEELRAPARSKLGLAQEGWLAQQLIRTESTWNLFAQGTLMTYADEGSEATPAFRNDTWNGYHAARERLMNVFAESRVRNAVVLSGDIHAFVVANLHRVPQNRDSEIVASELVATSISAEGSSQTGLDHMRQRNSNILFADSGKRGYLRLDVTSDRLQADLVGLDSVTQANANSSVQTRFVVESGQPGPVAA